MQHKIRWTTTKIAQRLSLIESMVYRRRESLPDFHLAYTADPRHYPVFPIDYTNYLIQKPDTYWAGADQNFILDTTFCVPSDWGKDAAVAIYLPLGIPGSFSHPEALVYIDQKPFATCDRHHQEILLRPEWCDGQPHQLTLHGWTGNDHQEGEHARLLMRQCAAVQIDQPTRDFVAAVRVALGIATLLGENEPARNFLLNALNDAFNQLDTREPLGDEFYASLPAAHQTLRDGITAAGQPLDVSITATGHAHIDVAWLWTVNQVRNKTSRTFHTVLRLMEQFPEYHFTQSQPQLYDFIQQDHPALLEEIKSRVAEGRWEPIGGMWVEADCNLSGSESLARQFLLGRTFFRQHFGAEAESPVLWLPDVFGYAWNLPQLIKEAGLEYFFTIKIGWSQYNRLPYDSFWWQGLDGTRVLTHFSTTKEIGSPFASTYNAMASPAEVLGTWQNFQQKEIPQDLLMSYGYGDGGGGPTREMLENIREMSNFPATPRTHQGSVRAFFDKLNTEHGHRLPTWNGELYLEIHRGTYTTQSRNKRANRKSEFLLHDAEFIAALASTIDSSYTYPAAAFWKAWELICLNQFHDIIPGSSINQVYIDSQQDYMTIRDLAQTALQEALQVITTHQPAGITIINPTSFTRSDLALWQGHLEPGQQLRTESGSSVQTQSTSGGTWIALDTIAPYSVQTLQIVNTPSVPTHVEITASPDCLENDAIRVELNTDGDITRIFDKLNNREVLPAGQLANQFQIFEDRPVNWDAWDIDIFYDDRMWTIEPAQSIRVIESGPLRATLEIKRRVRSSSYIQYISISRSSPRIDFTTTIDWRERHTLLKVAFPVDILSPVATHEIQWGNVQRPTHRNTSWDWGRFETCAHKWVDLSEGDYGVSLLNDCKYGHDIQANVIRLSLLRSPTSPDPEADQGEHTFSYSLLPHSGDWRTMTAGEAYALNDPLITVTSEGTHTQGLSTPLVTTDNPGLIIETVKRSEDGNGLIIRLYESQRQRGVATLSTAFRLTAAYRANILEENQEALQVAGNQITLPFKPYQIITLRLIPA